MRVKEEIMRKEFRALLAALLLGLPFACTPCSGASKPEDAKPQRNERKYQEKLTKEGRHQLVLLPYYSVFDNLGFKVVVDKVTLLGRVVGPTLKSDAEAA